VPQPRLTDIALSVAIYPHAPRIETMGRYVFENRTGKPLPQMHVRWDRDLEMRKLVVDGAHPVKTYDRFHYVIFAFDRPMAPGERRTMRFETVLEQKGFKNSGDITRVVDNGTFVNNTARS